MNAPVTRFPASSTLSSEDWQHYRANLPRHLIGLSRYMQSRLMHSLTQDHGHGGLRLHFEPYIALATTRGVQLSTLADTLKVSRQSVNQVVNQIEAVGYLERVADSADRRSKRVVLTPLGQKLVKDGAKLLGSVEAEFAAIIGNRALERFTLALDALYRAAAAPNSNAAADTAALGWLLPRSSNVFMQVLMDATRERGHPDLKMSFGQVLPLIGPEGGRISDIARINEVSKQAISAIAQELEALGYLTREADPLDARQRILVLSEHGATLITDAVASTRALEAQLTDAVGEACLLEVKTTAQSLFDSLALETAVFGRSADDTEKNIEQLAQDLLGSLGPIQANRLAQTITRMTETTP